MQIISIENKQRYNRSNNRITRQEHYVHVIMSKSQYWQADKEPGNG